MTVLLYMLKEKRTIRFHGANKVFGGKTSIRRTTLDTGAYLIRVTKNLLQRSRMSSHAHFLWFQPMSLPPPPPRWARRWGIGEAFILGSLMGDGGERSWFVGGYGFFRDTA